MIKITKATRKQIKAFNEKEWHDTDFEHYGRRVDWNEKKFLFMAVEDGQMLGTISGKHISGVLYINTIIVAKSKRGKGVGTALMNKAEEFGKKERAHKSHLLTGKDWEAVRFYESFGYKRVALLPNHNFGKDFIIFEKFI